MQVNMQCDGHIIDSSMSLYEALRVTSGCPELILEQQRLLGVTYIGTDAKMHNGQIVIHEALEADVSDAFEIILKEQIPIGSAIPISHPRFNWDDLASMKENNSCGFNYRKMVTSTGEKECLSLHSFGIALDINPVNNPCYGKPQVHRCNFYIQEAAAGYQAFVPENALYDISYTGSFHNRHPLVLFLKERGWTWGGEWAEPKDLHHFQKIPTGYEEIVQRA